MNKEIPETYDAATQGRKVENLKEDLYKWKSNLDFMKDEIHFIERLLNSYIFEPNTPNLFERLQEYLGQIKKSKKCAKEVLHQIADHKKHLGGMIECRDEQCDFTYYSKHELIKAEFADCMFEFQNLKSEIFSYAGGILKKRKPKGKM